MSADSEVLRLLCRIVMQMDKYGRTNLKSYEQDMLATFANAESQPAQEAEPKDCGKRPLSSRRPLSALLPAFYEAHNGADGWWVVGGVSVQCSEETARALAGALQEAREDGRWFGKPAKVCKECADDMR